MHGELAAGGVQRRHQQRARRGGARQPDGARDARRDRPAPSAPTCSSADCVSEPTILCVEVSAASAPRCSALAGTPGWKPKCGPQLLVDDQRHVARVGDVGQRRRRRRPARSRWARRRSPPGRPGVASSASRERLRRDAVGHPELVVVLRRHERRQAAGEHEAVDHRRVRVALDDHRRAERRERQAQRVVALRGAVGEEPGLRGAVGGGGELLGAVVRRRLRPEVDALDVLRDVELQRGSADRVAQAGVGAARRPCGRARGSASRRGSRRRRARRGRARPAARRRSGATCRAGRWSSTGRRRASRRALAACSR